MIINAFTKCTYRLHQWCLALIRFALLLASLLWSTANIRCASCLDLPVGKKPLMGTGGRSNECDYHLLIHCPGSPVGSPSRLAPRPPSSPQLLVSIAAICECYALLCSSISRLRSPWAWVVPSALLIDLSGMNCSLNAASTLRLYSSKTLYYAMIQALLVRAVIAS